MAIIRSLDREPTSRIICGITVSAAITERITAKVSGSKAITLKPAASSISKRAST
jgi:hypothetical protein